LRKRQNTSHILREINADTPYFLYYNYFNYSTS